VEALKLKNNTITFDKASRLTGGGYELFPAISRGLVYFEQKGDYIHIETEIFFDHQIIRAFFFSLIGLTSFIYIPLQESFTIIGIMLATQTVIYFITIQRYLTFFYETFSKQGKKLEFLSY